MNHPVDDASPYPLAPWRGQPPPAPAWFKNALAVPFEQVPLECDGVALELLCWGEAGRPGVLLLHGNNAHARWWSPIAALLASKFRVAALSWSGMGGSGWRSAYSIAGYAEEAIAAARAAGLFTGISPILVGHSFGGCGTLEAALRYGDELAGVIVIDSQVTRHGGKPALRSRTSNPVYASEGAALARFRLAPPQPCANLFYLDWVARHGLRRVERDEQHEAGWTWRIDPALWAKLDWHDKWYAFTHSRCPVAIVTGASSRIVPPGDVTLLQQDAPPGTCFETIADAGHHVMLDQPLAVVDAIERMASKLGAVTRGSARFVARS